MAETKPTENLPVPTIGNLPAVMSSDPAAIAAAESAKQRIQAAYIMATQRPRNVDDARAKILHACKRPGFAECVEYSKPIGNTHIKGPSIRFAELALREWGNVLSDINVVYEDKNVRRSKVIITDLETNCTFTKEISVRKTVERKKSAGRIVIAERINSYGGKIFIVAATDDELHNKEAALISKALRNEGLRIIPSDIVEESLLTARETLQVQDAQDPDASKKRVLDSFAGLSIYPADLEQYLKHSTERIAPKELEELRRIYQSINSGDAKWEDYIAVTIDKKTGEVISKTEKVAKKLAGKDDFEPPVPNPAKESMQGTDKPKQGNLV